VRVRISPLAPASGYARMIEPGAPRFHAPWFDVCVTHWNGRQI